MTYETRTFEWKDYSEMWTRINRFKMLVGRLPNYADIKGLRIYQQEYLDAKRRVEAFIKENKRNPYTVRMTGEILIIKSEFHKLVEASIGGTYDNFTGFYNHVKDEVYKSYNSDVYSQKEALNRLKAKQGLNCTDLSQIGYAVAKDLGGYQVEYVHVKCRVSGQGHIRLRIKGREFNDWTGIDLAACAYSNYPIGKVWCADGINIPVTNESHAWLFSDDGVT